MNPELNTLLESLNIAPLSVTELKTKRVYMVATKDIPLVVKFTPLSWAVDEVFFLQSLETNFIPHPKLLHFGKLDDEVGYLITEYMPNAVDTLNDDLRADANFWHVLATGLQQINSIPVAGFGFNRGNTFGVQNFTSPSFLNFIKTILQELSDKLQNSPYSKLVDELTSKQSNLMEKEQAYLAHGDFGGNNYLWYPDTQKIYFFDAGYLRGMPKTWDIAYFGWRIDPQRVTDTDVIAFTDHYFEQPPDDYTKFEIAFFKSLIALMKVSDGFVNNQVDDKHAAAANQNLASLEDMI
jgi:Phosphotransferase enzyme family